MLCSFELRIDEESNLKLLEGKGIEFNIWNDRACQLKKRHRLEHQRVRENWKHANESKIQWALPNLRLKKFHHFPDYIGNADEFELFYDFFLSGKLRLNAWKDENLASQKGPVQFDAASLIVSHSRIRLSGKIHNNVY